MISISIFLFFCVSYPDFNSYFTVIVVRICRWQGEITVLLRVLLGLIKQQDKNNK